MKVMIAKMGSGTFSETNICPEIDENGDCFIKVTGSMYDEDGDQTGVHDILVFISFNVNGLNNKEDQ